MQMVKLWVHFNKIFPIKFHKWEREWGTVTCESDAGFAISTASVARLKFSKWNNHQN